MLPSHSKANHTVLIHVASHYWMTGRTQKQRIVPSPRLSIILIHTLVSSCHQCLLLLLLLLPSSSKPQSPDRETKHKTEEMMHRVLLPHLLILATLAISILAENDSIYEILRAHALPMGLLPKGVKEYNIDTETGQFSVYLNRSCKAKYESEIHYEANITGTIGYGSIGGLSGVKAQELFLWFPVKGIRVDIPSSGVIYFDVGVVRKQYSMALFETPRDCVAVENEVEFRGDDKIRSSMLQYYEVDQSVGRNIV